jgi:hypothetical protein
MRRNCVLLYPYPLSTHQREKLVPIASDNESRGGQRLLRKADFHVGCRINANLRVFARPPPGQKFPKKRHCGLYGGLDGSIGYFMPIDEKPFRRFSMLMSKMGPQLMHNAGLNPKAYRYAVLLLTLTLILSRSFWKRVSVVSYRQLSLVLGNSYSLLAFERLLQWVHI